MRIRTFEQLTADGDLPWFAGAAERVRSLPRDADPSIASFLEPGQPVTIARAPGRLDVMGGIADYSGSLVLEMPLACATTAVAQQQDDLRLDILSFRGDRPFRFSIDMAPLVDGPSEELAEDPAVMATYLGAEPS